MTIRSGSIAQTNFEMLVVLLDIFGYDQREIFKIDPEQYPYFPMGPESYMIRCEATILEDSKRFGAPRFIRDRNSLLNSNSTLLYLRCQV